MAVYIEKGQLLTCLYSRQDDENLDVMVEIANFPVADVAPVVRSYWEAYTCSQYIGTDEFGNPRYRDGRYYVCHNRKCRRKTVTRSNYCPNCGAKMDGGSDE